ncbi:hypothetical protein [Faecalimonas umbilicata]|uniref:hypothetical protein n=1 Tax=Faecalimonas umbilicata TaxID=1912855 RepID=UPI0022E9248B|nr:hypothetical protein [Faecalimonas umbilicata]
MRKKLSNESRVMALLAFTMVFVFQIILNLNIPTMRSIPDEIGSMAYAAKITGHNWNYVLTHPSLYYGSGTFLLQLPFFVLVKNPLILYQCLLGVAAFLHAVPAYISCRILQKYYKITENKIYIIFIGVICALFTPTRSSNSDNEPMLIFLCWVLVYLIVALQFTESKKKQVAFSIIAALVLAISYLSHTRAIIYSIIIIFLFLVYHLLTKRSLINYIAFAITYLISMAGANEFVQYLRKTLFTSDITVNVSNTPDMLVENATNNLRVFTELTGIRSFIDLLCSNIWVIFIFSCGTLFLISGIFFIETKKNLKMRLLEKNPVDNKTVYFPLLFCLGGTVIALVGVCILGLSNALVVHTESANLSRSHFYLRYYGNFFGPIFLFLVIYIWGGSEEIRKKLKKIAVVNICVLIFAMGYCLGSFLFKVSVGNEYTHNLDWFYYFAPFSGMLNAWPNTVQTLSYFWAASVVAIVIFIILIRFHRKKSVFLSVMLIALVWQYTYGVLRFDAPFAKSEHYYKSVDSAFDFYMKEQESFEKYDEIYYYSPTYGPAYIVQFMFPQKQVITELELLNNEENNVILSDTNLSLDDLGSNSYKCFQLDENEYLYSNDISLIKKLDSEGYEAVNLK